MNDVLPDALAGVLGKIVAEARREWIKSADLIAAEARATIAELKAENAELRGQLRGIIDGEINRLREATATVKDGRDGTDGQQGEQGPPGPPPDYGIVLERSEPLIKNLIAARWDDWTKTLPLPERGEPGLRGEPGKDADPELIERLVAAEVAKMPAPIDVIEQAVTERVKAAVEALPPPERGEKGEPADPDAVAKALHAVLEPQIAELASRLVADEIAAGLAKVPPPARGEKGEAGEPGKDGRDADPVLVADKLVTQMRDFLARAVSDEVKTVVATLPPPERGEKGEPGRDADPAEIAKTVREEVEPQMRDLIPLAVTDEVQRAVAELPPAEKGEPGRDGKDADQDAIIKAVLDRLPPPEKGEPGKDADPDVIRGMVAEEVGKLPPAKDGAPGRDGRDVDPAVIEATIVAHVAKALGELPKPRDGVDGPAGAKGDPGPPGRDGQDADPAAIEAIVVEKVAEAVSVLPPPEKGEPGPRGEVGPRGEKGDPGDRGEQGLGLSALRLIDGDELWIEWNDGSNGYSLGHIKGDQGPRGEKGDPGRDGVSLAGCLIDRKGNLILTLSDGTARELGEVVGKDGAPGRDGQDGKDGLSFGDFELDPEYDGERTVRLKWTNGAKTQVREWRLPVVLDRGVYRAGASYEKGDAVTFAGCVWIAQRDTADKPGEGATGWRLAVKSGRHGKDGEPGVKGEKGDQGPPGRDWTAQGLR